jgi:hypothetical protein
MKNLSVITLLLIAGCSVAQPNSCRVDPGIFCAPFEQLEQEMPAEAKKELLTLPKDQYIQMHFGLGMTVRNRFGLWQDNEITQFFRRNGVDHPDDMSMPFIGGFVEHLQGHDVDMVKAIETYGLPPPPVPPPPAAETK